MEIKLNHGGEHMNPTSEYDYKKYLQLVSKKKYLFVSLALVIMIGVVITSYLLPEKYEAKCTVFIEKSVISELVKGIAITPSFDEKLKVLAYTLKSRSLLTKVFNDLDMNTANPNSGQLEKTVKLFQDNTDIRLKDKEGLFTITFNNENPRLARDYVNTLVRRYIEENTSTKREESYGATNFLAEQIETVKVKLEEAEARSNSYKRDNGAVLGQSESALLGEISYAQQRIEEIAIKRRQLEIMLARVKDDPLKAKLATLQNKKQELSVVYTDNHPELQEIKNEIVTLKERLHSGSTRGASEDTSSLELEKITMELNSLRDLERTQRHLIASKQSLLRGLPAARTSFDELEREKNSQKVLYEQLVARRGQSEVAKQMEVQDKTTTFRIVDPAVIPTKPISPQRVKIILLGVLGGLVASFAFIVLLDQLDNSVRSIEALKSLGVRILAVVPTIENPIESVALRRRDYWFYGIAGTCFLLVLATIPFELLRNLPVDTFSTAGLKAQLLNFSLK